MIAWRRVSSSVLLLGLVLAGGLQAMALAVPGQGRPLWWLQILSLAVLAQALVAAPTGRNAAWRGWVFATAWLVATFWWLFISMHTYGGLPAPLAAAAVGVLAAFLGGYYALASWGFWHLAQNRPAQVALIFAASWTLAELARGWLWTGFPWGAGGYAHVEGPLSMLPRWLGVYGTGAVAAALAMGLARLHAARLSQWRTWLLVLALGGLGLGLHWHQGRAQAEGRDRPSLEVALLQGNIPQDEKFVPGVGMAQALQWYGQQLRSLKAPLLVLPETALPLLPQQLPEDYWQAIRAPFQQGSQAAIVGLPLGDDRQGYSNSVLGWRPGMADYRYDKHHLVPFGEFVPPLFQWFVDMMHIPLGSFMRGGVDQPSMAWRGERLAPNICYEDLFGEELGARFRDPAQAPTILVNVSNIAWFGDSVAVDQHLAISRMRALEFERPMLRATNTGATAVIDHRGKVVDQLPPHTRGVLHAQVQGRETITPFARWVAWAGGQWPLGLLCLVLLLAAARRTRHAPW